MVMPMRLRNCRLTNEQDEYPDCSITVDIGSDVCFSSSQMRSKRLSCIASRIDVPVSFLNRRVASRREQFIALATSSIFKSHEHAWHRMNSMARLTRGLMPWTDIVDPRRTSRKGP